MQELSVSVTAGNGSEKHNHDREYRKTLEHVLEVENGVIEFVGYTKYNEQINKIVRPYIELNNKKREEQYFEELERYEKGERKTKPRKNRYLGMGFDYAADHPYRKHRNPSSGKVEISPLYRSLIITLGNIENRRRGDYTEEDALHIFQILAEEIAKRFPHFHILAATVHMDEQGAIHIHIDYFICCPCDVWRSGKPFLYGMDSVMTKMGFSPELSIISMTEERKPLLFNAFRNRIYEMMEEILPLFGFRLQYGVSEKRNPGKDPRKNQSLEQYQYNRDLAREMQHYKNVMLDILESPDFQVRDFPSALSVFEKIQDIVKGKNELLPVVNNHCYAIGTEMVGRFYEACLHIMGEGVREVLVWYEKLYSTVSSKTPDMILAEKNEKPSLDAMIANAQSKMKVVRSNSGYHVVFKRE